METSNPSTLSNECAQKIQAAFAAVRAAETLANKAFRYCANGQYVRAATTARQGEKATSDALKHWPAPSPEAKTLRQLRLEMHKLARKYASYL